MLNYTRLRVQASSYKTLFSLLGKPVEGLHDNPSIYDEFAINARLLDPKMLELTKKLKATSENLDLAEQNTEYERLFTERDDKYLACPFSSGYQNMKSVGGLIQWIEGEYAKADFVSGNDKLPVDHIVTELEFIHKVIAKAAARLAEKEEAEAQYYSHLQCSFIADHALKWVPDFTRAIIFNSESPFYLQLAILARTMLVNCAMEHQDYHASDGFAKLQNKH